MAGRGGSETQSRAASAERNARTRANRVAHEQRNIQARGTPAPRPPGVAGDQPSGRTTTSRPMTGTGVGNPGAEPSGRVTSSRPMTGGVNGPPTPQTFSQRLQGQATAPLRGGASGGARGRLPGIAGAVAGAGAIGAGLYDAYRDRNRQAQAAPTPTPADPTPAPTPVEAQPENAPIAPPSRPTQARPQARPQTESMTADRLNAMSLALVQGRDPSPSNTAETIAVERMKQMMQQNEMARGGMAMKPKMPSVKPPKSPKMPSVKKPKLPQMPRMAKGGMAKKGKC